MSSSNQTRGRVGRRIGLGSAVTLLAAAVALPFNLGGGCSTTDILNTARDVPQTFDQLTLSEADEPAMGESVVIAVTGRYRLSADEKLNRYVNLVGMAVASASAATDIQFSFAVLDTDEVNAFSGPDGYVMVTLGALQRMEDESELAGVLGHEIGHIAMHHGLAVAKSAAASGAMAKVARRALDKTAQLDFVLDAGVQTVLSKGWAQPQEFAADEEAVRSVIKANYDPAGFERFIRKLDAAGGSLMSTHPGKAERVARIAKQIDAANARGKGQTLKERFAANVARQ
jgi:predicted Zn-dependent protease